MKRTSFAGQERRKTDAVCFTSRFAENGAHGVKPIWEMRSNPFEETRGAEREERSPQVWVGKAATMGKGSAGSGRK